MEQLSFRKRIRTKIKIEFVKLHVNLFNEFEKQELFARSRRRLIGYSSHHSGVKIVQLAKEKIGYNADTTGSRTIFTELYQIYKQIMQNPKQYATETEEHKENSFTAHSNP